MVALSRNGVLHNVDYDRAKIYRDANPWRKKVIAARRGHAKKTDCTSEEMTTIYGWDIDIMEYEASIAYEGLCPLCGEPFKKLARYPGDLGTITIDRIRLDLPPVYRLNTLWICFGCNARKGTTSIETLIERFIEKRRTEAVKAVVSDTIEKAQLSMWME